MKGIDTSSKQIRDMIRVINVIAFQKNFLALNAGIEAPRASNAGRGSAVVSTVVQARAQRSAKAAKEIEALTYASGQQVESGGKLVGEAGKALKRIVEQVGKLNGVIKTIAAPALEQATGLNEVNTAVNQMDQVKQRNAAMVDESTAASHALASEAQEHSQLVGQFHLGEVESEARRSTGPVFVPVWSKPDLAASICIQRPSNGMLKTRSNKG